jgi:hypothetical protein
MDLVLGQIIDSAINVEMNPHIHKGRTQLRYDIVRAKLGEPLTYLAARGLAAAIKPGDFVFFLSGAGLSPWLEYGETDGPGGVASLARAVDVGFGAHPVFIGDAKHLGPVAACARAAGVLVFEDEAALTQKKVFHSGLSIPFPLGAAGALEKAQVLLDRYQPSAVIAVEKQSPNSLGVFHTSYGWKIPAGGQAHVYHIALEAQKRGIFTLGIGDGGNEIGWGLVRQEYQAIYEAQFGATCQCGCGGGQATDVATDVLVSACNSNWGAYGVSAFLAYQLGDLQVLQDAGTERRMQEAMIAAGAMDVIHGAMPYVDGTSLEAQLAIVTTLREIVANALDRPRRTLFPPDYSEMVKDLD